LKQIDGDEESVDVDNGSKAPSSAGEEDDFEAPPSIIGELLWLPEKEVLEAPSSNGELSLTRVVASEAASSMMALLG
jgi:hypothetical protein